jgi:hypothetical protein
MARKEKLVTIDDEGRDNGRTFVLTEMDSWEATVLTAKIAHALAVSGIDIPAIAKNPEGLAEAGIRLMMYIAPQVGVPIMEQVKDCIQCTTPKGATVPMIEDNKPQEIRTWFTLFKEIFYLHLGFSEAASTPPTE